MTHPAIQVVTLKDRLLSKKNGRTKSVFYRPRVKQFAATHRVGLLRNSRIPMKRSPYLGYLRHSPSQKFQQNRFRFRSLSLDSYINSDSLIVEKSSPYVGFMRHAPPSRCKVHVHDTNHHNYTGVAEECKKEKYNSSDVLLFLRYPEQSKFISGRLPGGSPIYSYYSLYKWLADTDRSPRSNSHNCEPNTMETFEMFHKLATWFLFPVAYDQRSSYSFYDMKDDAYMEHVRRGISLISSLVKRIIPGRDALLICTGLQKMECDNLIPLPHSVISNIIQNSSLSSSSSKNNIDSTENNSMSIDTDKVIDSPSLPPNHPLHVSVSSLAKAYHVEQAQSDAFNLWSSQMSSEEMQRHLDIESILRLPIITYVTPSARSENSLERKEEEDEKTEDLIKDCDEKKIENKSNLEWSWISVEKDPQKIAEFPSESKKDGLHGGGINQIKEDKNQDQILQDEHCVICLERFRDGDRLRVLPCQHRFHSSCIDKWLSGSLSYEDCFTGLCPTCKKKPNVGNMSNSPSFEIGEDDSMGTMGEDMRIEGIVPSWAFTRLGGSIAKEK